MLQNALKLFLTVCVFLIPHSLLAGRLQADYKKQFACSSALAHPPGEAYAEFRDINLVPGKILALESSPGRWYFYTELSAYSTTVSLPPNQQSVLVDIQIPGLDTMRAYSQLWVPKIKIIKGAEKRSLKVGDLSQVTSATKLIKMDPRPTARADALVALNDRLKETIMQSLNHYSLHDKGAEYPAFMKALDTCEKIPEISEFVKNRRALFDKIPGKSDPDSSAYQ
jgi:hypothetical protein